MTLVGSTALSVDTSTKSETPVGGGDLHHVAGAYHVIAHGLEGVLLSQRNVLVGGGMKDEIRAVGMKDTAQLID